MLEEWSIEQRCVGMSFDTTASNTGKFAGACILLEALRGHSLLWTSGRHHMLEVILEDVFKVIFGLGSSPKVDYFFDILKSKWPTLNLSCLDLDKSDHTNLEPVDVYKRKAKESSITVVT